MGEYSDVINSKEKIEHGWNIHSLEGLKIDLKKNNFEDTEVETFNINIDVFKDQKMILGNIQ